MVLSGFGTANGRLPDAANLHPTARIGKISNLLSDNNAPERQAKWSQPHLPQP